ncbi:hypothetical protein M8J77_018120 [Diaphorina citri]|nr:hypothetical protein M8J77_018120 [Diaphorina citri]
MRRHLKQVHVEIKTFSCEECDKIFATREKLQRHWNYIHQGIRNTGPNQLLECHYCGITKNNKTLLRDHISAHLGIKPYCCIFCEEKYFSKKSLKRHEAKHNKVYNKAQYQDYQIQDLSMDQYRELVQSKERKCPKCEKEFSTPRYMRKHLREIHSAQKSHVCDQCGNQYKTKSSLGEHKKYMHSGKSRKKKYNKFQCNICGALHATKYTLRDHMNTHTGKKFKCDVCGNGYTSVKHLKRHKIKHMKESGELPPSMIHKCPTCYKIFTENHALKKHLDWVHGNKCHICLSDDSFIFTFVQEQYTLPIYPGTINVPKDRTKKNRAGKKRSNKEYMSALLKTLDIERKEVKKRQLVKVKTENEDPTDGNGLHGCDQCDFRTSNKKTLGSHILRRHVGYTVFCKECNIGFYSSTHLHSHGIKVHGLPPFICEHCSKPFTSKGNLTVHVKYYHAKTLFECNICLKTFNFKTSYKRHLKQHDDSVTYYPCTVCSKNLSSPYRLKTHMLIHANNRVFTCEVCGKGFIQKRYLEEHKRVHTGYKPYACDLCSKQFTQKSTLNIHRKLHLNIKDFICDLCGAKFVSKAFLSYHFRKRHQQQST